MSSVHVTDTATVSFPNNFYELPIFRSMTRAMIDQIAAIAVPLRFGDGEILFVEQDPATALFLVDKGAIRVTKCDSTGKEQEITVIQASSVVGEMSLLAGSPRSCSAYAVDDVVVYKVQRAHFYSLLDSDSIAAYRMVRNLGELVANRLRSMDEKMVQLIDQGTTDNGRQEMADLREKLFTEWAF